MFLVRSVVPVHSVCDNRHAPVWASPERSSVTRDGLVLVMFKGKPDSRGCDESDDIISVV